jgi:ribonuclease D
MTYKYFRGDLPDNLDLGGEIAIDTEALGLNNSRDRLCLVQITAGDGVVYIVHFIGIDSYGGAMNLKKLLADDKILKIFHYARFDMAILQKTFDIKIHNVYCTKIASKIARTYTEAHGLKAIVKEFFNVDISKREQSSYWGGKEISEEQLKYASNDVLFLHRIKEKLDKILDNEDRKVLAEKCFEFLPTRVELDLRGWIDNDIFNHE